MRKITALLLILSFVTMAVAQQAGEIRGTVLDSTGKGIAGAHVDIVNASGARNGRSTVTDVDGRYALVDLRAGKYNVQYSYQGCAIKIINQVIVSSDQSTMLHIKLKPAVGKVVEVIEYVRHFGNFRDEKIE